jgi:sulfite exporter TauE/SafE
MIEGLVGAAFVMGLAGAPHCWAMCAAPCAALLGGRSSASDQLALHGARCLSYGLGGFVVAATVGGLAQWSAASAALRPVWVAIHLLGFGLGWTLLIYGRQPAWIERAWASLGAGRVAASAEAGTVRWVRHADTGSRQNAAPPARLATGLLWLAWPCGLLQSALMMSALANSPLHGLIIMLAFGIGTSLALTLGPSLWLRLIPGAQANPALTRSWSSQVMPWANRLAGAMLVAGSGWAMASGVWAQVRAYCGL